MRVAAVQFFATLFDLTRNLQTAERLLRQAAAQGARLIVLPEFQAAPPLIWHTTRDKFRKTRISRARNGAVRLSG